MNTLNTASITTPDQLGQQSLSKKAERKNYRTATNGSREQPDIRAPFCFFFDCSNQIVSRENYNSVLLLSIRIFYLKLIPDA
jgi:hypothetical protein